MAPFITTPFVWMAAALVNTPSWSDLERILPTVRAPIYNDVQEIPDGIAYSEQDDVPIVFRDRQGINPYCQQVWLGFEVKGVNYVTVLVDDEDDTGGLPRVQWPDGVLQAGDSLAILQAIQDKYPDDGPNLYKRISKAVDNVGCNIVRFRGVFPRNTDLTGHSLLRAPFLFRDGQLVPKSNHMVSLEETDEVMEEYDDGPFLCGDFLCAADIVWAPFLERYAAQLPLVMIDDQLAAPSSLKPRSDAYETLTEWYEAMEEMVPSYVCRVGGDRFTWERTFQAAVKDGLVPDVKLRMPSGKNYGVRKRVRLNQNKIWSSYILDKPYLCSTPEEECAAHHIRNRDTIISDIVKQQEDGSLLSSLTKEEADEAFREVMGILVGIAKYNVKKTVETEGNVVEDEATMVQNMSESGRAMAAALESRLFAPRDMGILPASSLRHLVDQLGVRAPHS